MLGAMSAFGQEPAPKPEIKLVAIGQIARVDKPKRSFELRSLRDSTERTDGAGDFDAAIQFGRFPDPTIPERSRREDLGRFPNDPILDEPDAPPLPRFTTTKVFVTDATTCKADDKAILCDDLKTTDNVRVTGSEKSAPLGKGLYATEIVRTRTEPIR